MHIYICIHAKRPLCDLPFRPVAIYLYIHIIIYVICVLLSLPFIIQLYAAVMQNPICGKPRGGSWAQIWFIITDPLRSSQNFRSGDIWGCLRIWDTHFCWGC